MSNKPNINEILSDLEAATRKAVVPPVGPRGYKSNPALQSGPPYPADTQSPVRDLDV